MLKMKTEELTAYDIDFEISENLPKQKKSSNTIRKNLKKFIDDELKIDSSPLQIEEKKYERSKLTLSTNFSNESCMSLSTNECSPLGRKENSKINCISPTQVLEVVDETESQKSSSLSSLSQPLFWLKNDRISC